MSQATNNVNGKTAVADVKLTTDKRGRPVALRWSRPAVRWIRISYDDALLQIATGASRHHVPA